MKLFHRNEVSFSITLYRSADGSGDAGSGLTEESYDTGHGVTGREATGSDVLREADIASEYDYLFEDEYIFN